MWSDSQRTVLLGGHEVFEGGSAKRKRPGGWRNKTWMLHHDNIPAQTSLLIHEFLAKHEITFIPQLPYSPDLAPVDFSFCSQVEIQMIEEMEEISLWDLCVILQNAFQN
jgi:hypothetical protein